MSLEPFFSLSPLSPYQGTYDPTNPNAPYSYAHFLGYGVQLRLTGAYSLEGQYNTNQALLGYDPVPDTDQTLPDLISGLYRRCAVQLIFKGVNVSTTNQYLLVFRVARAWGSPIAQFFVGTSLVRAEALTQSPYDDIAILLDTPGDNSYVHAVVRLAAADNNFYHGFFFKGVDCYLL